MAARTLPQFLLDPGCRTALVAIVVWGTVSSLAVARPLGQAEASPRASCPSGDQGTPDARRVTHVRGVDARAAALLQEGPMRSATLKRLLDTLDQSNFFVLVETKFLKVPGQLTFVATSRAGRFVRITLNVPGTNDRLLAWLGHELQHAVEIASAPTVTSPEALVAFYRRRGPRVSRDGECSVEAQKVTALVLAEVGATRSAKR